MDVVTHAMTGLILAAPLAANHPLAAAAVMLGSVAPDLDSLARCFGKMAFLRWHQTGTHSLPLIVAAAMLAWVGWLLLGWPDSWAPLAFGAGMVFHVLLDLSNTYGVALLWPIRRKRWSLNRMFFIDGVFVALTAAALGLTAWQFERDGRSDSRITLGYLVAVGVDVLLRAGLYRWAWRQAPVGTVCLIPHAWSPWRFDGLTRTGNQVRPFAMSAFSNRIVWEPEVTALDQQYATQLTPLPAYRLMRELSAGYFATDSRRDGRQVIVICRDLRTRQFGGKFGMLELTFAPDGTLEKEVFHV